jgi:hypothetical protein
MKDLLERIKVLNRKTTEEEVAGFVEDLGTDYSIDLLEEAIKVYKARRKKILTGDLLEWMQENDLTTLETDDFKVTIRTFVKAGIDKENPEAEFKAFKWLEDNMYGDMIKDTLDLAKGEFTDEVGEALEKLGVSYTKKSGIHPQTLKKVMSDRLKAEEDLPNEDDGFAIDFFDECNVKER